MKALRGHEHLPPGGRGRGALVLDFDGVVCDGFLECVLVSWNAHFERPVAEFGPAGLERIPAVYLDRFRHVRSFARHLGHFLVPILASPAELATQARFDDCYAGLPADVVEAFVERATDYRAQVRDQQLAQWLGYHEIYPHVTGPLAAAAERVYIVTAKDSASVLQILSWRGVEIAPDRVYGEQRDKLAALADVCRREAVRAGDLHFVDDNLPNVLSARGAGHSGHWATWGFHAPEHVRHAAEHHVPALSAHDFSSVVDAALGLSDLTRRSERSGSTTTGVAS